MNVSCVTGLLPEESTRRRVQLDPAFLVLQNRWATSATIGIPPQFILPNVLVNKQNIQLPVSRAIVRWTKDAHAML
jgi:hypothetical protein